jgi:hypothetical protein
VLFDALYGRATTPAMAIKNQQHSHPWITYPPFAPILFPNSLTSHQASTHIFKVLLTSAQYTAAQYYRLAEKNGSKTLGNSWYVPSPLPPPSPTPSATLGHPIQPNPASPSHFQVPTASSALVTYLRRSCFIPLRSILDDWSSSSQIAFPFPVLTPHYTSERASGEGFAPPPTAPNLSLSKL